MIKTFKILVTAAVIFAAVAVVAVKYWQFVTNPWTRDGQVRAQVIQITPRVSAPIVDLPIKDNQFVKQGDLLFKLDPRTFQADLAQARANLDKTRDDLRALEKQVDAARAIVAEFEASLNAAKATIKRTKAEVTRTKTDLKRAEELLERGTTSRRRFDQAKADAESALSDQENAVAKVAQAEASKLQAEADVAEALANLGAPGEENAQLRAGKAAVESAELNLSFTEVRAPVDGFVTNLDLRLGSQGVANQPALALIDVNSFWLDGFFRENMIGDIQPGDKAVVTGAVIAVEISRMALSFREIRSSIAILTRCAH